ncbi:MAG: rhodanese-like domain-containing protein, partial [Boseongicola sp.]|nr:rhodanese-like domain-containing protein [Boseongicola sp.]
MGFELKSLVNGVSGFDMVIDVRSPSEFSEDRIPGAVSMPVLSDAE